MPLAFYAALLPLLVGYLLFIGLSGRFAFFYHTKTGAQRAAKRRAQWVGAVTALIFSGLLYFLAHSSLALSVTQPAAAAACWLFLMIPIMFATRAKPEKRRHRRRRQNSSTRQTQQLDEPENAPFDLYTIEDPYENLWPEVMFGFAKPENTHAVSKRDGQRDDSLTLASAYDIIEKERQRRLETEHHLRVTRKALAKMSRESETVQVLAR